MLMITALLVGHSAVPSAQAGPTIEVIKGERDARMLSVLSGGPFPGDTGNPGPILPAVQQGGASSVPMPGTLVLFGVGLAALWRSRGRR